MPIIARAFSELGYHRATTAELARRCDVRENILYRIWDDKKAMYIAAIHYVYEFSMQVWWAQATKRNGKFSLADVLEYESEHLGEFGHYRILFAGLSEIDDDDIRSALADVYKNFHAFIKRQIDEHRSEHSQTHAVDSTIAAWALIGLGTMSTIGREIGSMGHRSRRRLIREVGEYLTGVVGA